MSSHDLWKECHHVESIQGQDKGNIVKVYMHWDGTIFKFPNKPFPFSFVTDPSKTNYKKKKQSKDMQRKETEMNNA